MIAVDTSAIFAILYDEVGGAACERALRGDADLVASAATLAEARVVAARAGVAPILEEFLTQLEIEIVPVTAETAAAVGQAYANWGKGLHAAKLNFGDCFAYALAKQRDCPLLFIGDDFAQTDVIPPLR